MIEAIKSRRSIRKYKDAMPEREDIEKVIEAGLYAASGKNLQSSIIVAATNRDLRDRLSEMNRKIGGWDEGYDPFYGAPVVLIVLAERSNYNDYMMAKRKMRCAEPLCGSAKQHGCFAMYSLQ